ncbi:MAG TPA: DUF1501 domain-containing protein [Opitutaceae bacterium]|nr:DUF1501 domain-containing protein [Opitutaceae bacterium]
MSAVEPSPPRAPAGGAQPNCDAVGSTAMYSSLLNLTMTSRAAAEHLGTERDYKALVCLFLDGGNDSYNMLVPREEEEFARYRRARGDLALARGDLLEINDPAGGGRSFGIHPAMPEIRDLYQAGQLSFVCNVGTLVERTNLADIQRYTARLPLGLYSHADQVMHWQTSTPDARGSVGWAGRAAEVLQALNEKDAVSMNISLSGTNVFQSGRNLVPYSITPDGVSLLRGYDDPTRPFFQKAVDSMLELRYQSLLKQTYASLTRTSISSANRFLSAWNAAPRVTTAFPETVLGRGLRGVAQAIAARENLGMRRQTFFVRSAGWDHHDEVLASQSTMLRTVSEAVGSFWHAIGNLGLQDRVVLFTVSDFGRTLSSNGRGSDHGWGGHQFVVGGPQQGGRLYGRYPEDLSLGNGLDTGRGRLIPTTSVDEYFAELALWLGVARSDLGRTLPNIERFYSVSSDRAPLGLFN